MIIINKIDFKSKNPTSNSGTFLLFETAKINLTFAVVGVLVISIFILFFTIEKNDIGKDISKKYENVVILSDKNTIATQIFFFSVGKAEIGIANYIKMPLLDRYYCQKHYVLDNTEEKPKINDVLKGRWQGYIIEATPEVIIIQNVDPGYGIYWYIMYFGYLIFSIEALLYYRQKKRR